ncbi:50S ribosomal protein L32 [Myceligenerans cantabricum]
MAVPKRKMSRSRTRSRRSQWKATLPVLVAVTTPDGRSVRVPQHLAGAARRGML